MSLVAPPTGDGSHMDKYQKLEKVGEGTYGVVVKAREKTSGRLVACKRIRLESADDGLPATALREIAILRELRHANIVSLLSVIHSQSKLTLVFEYMDFDLRKCIDKYHGRLPSNIVRSFLWQLLRGVAFCHSRRVLHRDLKPQNLLVSRNGQLKIADFGLARGVSIPVRSYTSEVVTLWYREPAILLGSKRYGSAVDLWSCGTIFAEMVTGRPLFQGRNDRDQLQKIFRILGTPQDDEWPGWSSLPGFHSGIPNFPKQRLEHVLGVNKSREGPTLENEGLDLLRKMLVYNPEQRITAKQALEHPYFAELRNAQAKASSSA